MNLKEGLKNRVVDKVVLYYSVNQDIYKMEIVCVVILIICKYMGKFKLGILIKLNEDIY
jgi:hypothetical protein